MKATIDGVTYEGSEDEIRRIVENPPHRRYDWGDTPQYPQTVPVYPIYPTYPTNPPYRPDTVDYPQVWCVAY